MDHPLSEPHAAPRVADGKHHGLLHTDRGHRTGGAGKTSPFPRWMLGLPEGLGRP